MMHANGRTLSEIKARLTALRTVDKETLLRTLREVLQEKRFVRVIAAPAVTAPLK